MIETSLTIGMALTVVTGALQLGIFGVTQLEADGSSFIGAHDAAVVGGGSANQQNQLSAAQSVVAAIFPQVASSGVTVTATDETASAPASSLADVRMSFAVPTFISASGKLDVRSHVNEAAPVSSTQPQPNPNLGFAVAPAPLPNSPIGSAAAWIAQTVYASNGPHARFDDWRCHEKYLDQLTAVWPANRTSVVPANLSATASAPTPIQFQLQIIDQTHACS